MTRSEPIAPQVEVIAIPVKQPRKPSATPKAKRSVRSVKSERLLIQDPVVILEQGELDDTRNHPGCLSVFNGRVGLSFKGLTMVIDLKVGTEVYECLPGTFQPLTMSAAHASHIRQLLQVWFVWNQLMETEQDEASTDEAIEQARSILNREYDEFIATRGYVNDNKHLLRFESMTDSRLGLLLALEDFSEASETWVKADCFSERTSFPQYIEQGQLYFDEDVSDRIAKAFVRAKSDGDGITIDLDRIAKLTGLKMAEVEQELVELGLAVRSPRLPIDFV